MHTIKAEMGHGYRKCSRYKDLEIWSTSGLREAYGQCLLNTLANWAVAHGPNLPGARRLNLEMLVGETLHTFLPIYVKNVKKLLFYMYIVFKVLNPEELGRGKGVGGSRSLKF